MLSFLSADGSNNKDFQDPGAARRRWVYFFEVGWEDMCEHNIFGVDDTCGNMGGWIFILENDQGIPVFTGSRCRWFNGVFLKIFERRDPSSCVYCLSALTKCHKLRVGKDLIGFRGPTFSESIGNFQRRLYGWCFLIIENETVFVSISGCTFGVW